MPVFESELVILNATSEDLDSNKVRMEGRIARLKAEKKKKKEVKQESETAASDNKSAPGPSSKPLVTKTTIEKSM